MLLNLADHFQAIWPAVVANQNSSLRFEHAPDLAQNSGGVIKAMQRAVRNNQVKVTGLEPHVPRISHLENRSIVEFPGRCGLAGAFNKRSGCVEAHGDEVLVMPDDFQRNQPDSGSDIEHDPALDAEAQSARGKLVLQFSRMLASSRFYKSLDVF